MFVPGTVRSNAPTIDSFFACIIMGTERNRKAARAFVARIRDAPHFPKCTFRFLSTLHFVLSTKTKTKTSNQSDNAILS